MAERLALIVNPAATRTRAGLLQQVEDVLSPLGLGTVAVTSYGGHAAVLAAEARDAGATIVVPLGGDGTVNEVAGVLSGTDIAVAPLPGGSTNVFARALGWPYPLAQTLPALAAALVAPDFRDVILGRVQAGDVDRIFCVNAGVGLDAETVHLVEARPWIKTRFRHAGFAATTLVAAVREARHPPDIAVSVDGGATDLFTAAIVACGSPYAFFGPRPLDLVPSADFGPRLRWIGLRSARLRSLGAIVGGALRGGRHLARAAVASGWADREIVIRTDRPVAVQADGEPLGYHEAIRLAPGPTLRTLRPPPAR